MNKPETFTLGGREFRSLSQSTIEHDMWVVARMRMAGIHEFYQHENETQFAFATRVINELIDSGQALEILGGLLLPAELDPLDWTPKVAAETAAFIRKLTDPEDKNLVQLLISRMLVDFFETGTALRKIFQNSSSKPGPAAPVN